MYSYYNALWLFLTVPRVGLQCVIVVFPDYTQLLFVNPFLDVGTTPKCPICDVGKTYVNTISL